MDKENILKICNNNSNTLMETLGIVFIDVGDDFVTAKMPVTSKVTSQMEYYMEEQRLLLQKLLEVLLPFSLKMIKMYLLEV